MNTHTLRPSLVLVLGALVALAGCTGATYPIEVTGDTGLCTDSDTVWSGEPVAGLEGTVLERAVHCAGMTMSDERLSGTSEHRFRCEFSQDGEDIVGDCVTDATITNDGGTWHSPDGRMAITISPTGPATIVEDLAFVGSGDYEGLRYTNHVEGLANDYPWPITGTIERDS